MTMEDLEGQSDIGHNNLTRDWLENLPEEWQIKPLKWQATYNDDVLSEDTLPEWRMDYIEISDVIHGRGVVSKASITFEKSPSRARRVVRKGDVIVSTVRTYLKATAYIGDELDGAVASTGFAVLRSKSGLNQKYLGHVVSSEGFIGHLVARSKGISYPAINASDLVEIDIPLPPIGNQEAIVAFLDRETAHLDGLIERKNRLLELMEEQRRAVISQAVTRGLNPDAPLKDSGVPWLGQVPKHWEVMSIKRLASVKRGASPRPIDDPIYFDDEGEYGWVRISDVTSNGRYLDSTEQRLSKVGQDKSVQLEPGRIFISIAGSVGKVCITRIKCCIHDGFVYFDYFKQDPDYFYYLLALPNPYEGLGKMGTQLNLNTDTIGGIYVPVPSITEQQAIAAYLDIETAKLDVLRQKLEQSIKHLREYRAALITAAVTGQINVREEATQA